jgi:hypothetical protein
MREIDSAGRCFPQKEWILLRSEAQVEIKLYEKEDFMSRTEELCLETLQWKGLAGLKLALRQPQNLEEKKLSMALGVPYRKGKK